MESLCHHRRQWHLPSNRKFDIYDSDGHGCTYNNNWHSVVYDFIPHTDIRVMVGVCSLLSCRCATTWTPTSPRPRTRTAAAPPICWKRTVLVRHDLSRDLDSSSLSAFALYSVSPLSLCLWVGSVMSSAFRLASDVSGEVTKILCSCPVS